MSTLRVMITVKDADTNAAKVSGTTIYVNDTLEGLFTKIEKKNALAELLALLGVKPSNLQRPGRDAKKTATKEPAPAKPATKLKATPKPTAKPVPAKPVRKPAKPLPKAARTRRD